VHGHKTVLNLPAYGTAAQQMPFGASGNPNEVRYAISNLHSSVGNYRPFDL